MSVVFLLESYLIGTFKKSILECSIFFLKPGHVKIFEPRAFQPQIAGQDQSLNFNFRTLIGYLQNASP